MNTLYTDQSYPELMENLPEDVRHRAIKNTNDMLVDGNVRYHRDLIILMAINEAKRWAEGKEKQNSN